ncbi:MAG: hypothetical protein E6J92_02210 [Methanobacteriota archaeon]|nr:MAG: hypothetical protein E6K00_04920 [Euryarchaeota archaeon]TMA03322.1 MAG: hypothetical protein E6J92_02210 [Euryarchaeota archaeon]
MARPPPGRPMTRGTTCPQRPFAATLGLVLGLTLAALLPLVLAQPAKAANVSINLFANAFGWNITSGEETNPGPTFVVYHNDQITVTLTSDDGLPHGLWIDYSGDGIQNSEDYLSPKTSVTQNPITFSFLADHVGQYTYADQVIPLNTGQWSTHDNGAPSATIRAPVLGASWTGGKAHDISFNLTDPDGDPMTYNLTYSYGGRASQSIRSSTPASGNPNVVSWTPTGFSATDTVLHLDVLDSRGAPAHVDSAPFEVDSTPPTIASSSPLSDAVSVDRNTLIQVNWSEGMNESTTGAANAFGVRGSGGPWLTGTVAWSPDATQFTFRPSGTLADGTVYEVHVNSTATDHSDPGNPYAGSMWRFSTGSTADRTPPSILAMAADPSVQVVDGFVNLTTDVQDNVGILTVTASVRGPGFDQNLTMVHASGTRWYVNRTYSAVGHYAFTVWATDRSGNVRSQTAGFDMSPPGSGSVPAPLYVNVSMTDGVVDVTWSPVSSPTLAGYYVYRGNGTAGQYTRLTITPIPKAAPTVYRDSSVQPGHTYFYTVTSVNTTGAESGYAQAISVTIPPYTTPPLFDPVPWAVAGVTLGVILGALYGMVWRRRPA